MRAMALGGLSLVSLGRRKDPARPAQGPTGAARQTRRGVSPCLPKAGFKKNDVIVAIAGSSTRETEGQLIGRLLRSYQAGSVVNATVLRDEERLELTLPMQ
ncbi:MAG: PDZ domain-containing protein [Verrucomicrobiota bacterium]